MKTVLNMEQHAKDNPVGVLINELLPVDTAEKLVEAIDIIRAFVDEPISEENYDNGKKFLKSLKNYKGARK